MHFLGCLRADNLKRIVAVRALKVVVVRVWRGLKTREIWRKRQKFTKNGRKAQKKGKMMKVQIEVELYEDKLVQGQWKDFNFQLVAADADGFKLNPYEVKKGDKDIQ